VTLVISLLLISSIATPKVCGQPTVGSEAPDFNLATPYGYNVTLGDLISDGKPLVLIFFAYYCPHCRAELDQLSKEWKYCPSSDNAHVLLVGVSGEPEADQEYFESLGVKGWEFAEGTKEMVMDYELYAVPTILVISPDGVVRFAKIGPTEPRQLCDIVGRYSPPPAEESGLPGWAIPAIALAAVLVVALVLASGRRRRAK